MMVEYSAQLRDELLIANANFMTVFKSGDAAAVAECYTVDGALLPPGSEPIAGRPGIAAFWAGAMQLGVARAILQTVDVVGDANSNAAAETGRYQLLTQAGDEIDRGKYIVLWLRDGAGRWQMSRDIWNTSKPSPS